MARILPTALLAVLLNHDAGLLIQASSDSALESLLNPSTDPALAAAAPPAPPAPLLWLPLGDSITWGCGTDAKPR
eukprot:COSAG02_NODE_4742_length_5034_cov_6.121986_3_plen_75_part_00